MNPGRKLTIHVKRTLENYYLCSHRQDQTKQKSTPPWIRYFSASILSQSMERLLHIFRLHIVLENYRYLQKEGLRKNCVFKAFGTGLKTPNWVGWIQYDFTQNPACKTLSLVGTCHCSRRKASARSKLQWWPSSVLLTNSHGSRTSLYKTKIKK